MIRFLPLRKRFYQSGRQSRHHKLTQDSQHKRFIWTPIPISLGVLVIAGIQYRKIASRPKYETDHDIKVDGDWYVHLYMMLPLRTLSRWWGEINSMTVPDILRKPLYKSYVNNFS